MSISNPRLIDSKSINSEQQIESSAKEPGSSIVPKITIIDPEVKPIKPRRSYDNAYKARILAAYEACQTPAERGALLRREGLYSSTIPAWRKKQANDKLKGKSQNSSPRIDHLTKENEQLKKKLAQAEAIIDLQKKVSELFGTHILPLDVNEENS